MADMVLPFTLPFTLGEPEPTVTASAIASGATVDVTIRLQTLGGQWETCGADRAIGVLPDTVSLTANAWGADKASFNLVRSPASSWPDIAAYTPVEIEIAGVVVWTGRTRETPVKDGAERVINVQCEGNQYQLDDDVYQRAYVHSKLTDWKDARSFHDADLSKWLSSPQVQVGSGSISIVFPDQSPVIQNVTTAGVVLDLGPNGLAKRIVLSFANNNFGGEFYTLYVRSADSVAALTGPAEGLSEAIKANVTAIPTSAGTFSVAHRYVAILIGRTGATAEHESGDHHITITGVSVFADTAYESGNASVLKASQVIPDALERATKLLSADHSLIQATSFNIPDFTLSKQSTPREAIEAANAYHDWLTRLDILDRVVFAPRPSTPLLEIGAWSGAETEDASANSGQEIYSRVLVEATGPDGTPVSVERTRTAAQPETLVERRGFRRTKVLQVNSAITTAEGEQLGSVYLAGHVTTPFKGSAKITPGGVRSVIGGISVHPSRLLLHTQDLLRLAHVIDPDTGGVGRDGTIATVTYTHRDQVAQVELDDPRGNFDALLARLQVVQTPGS